MAHLHLVGLTDDHTGLVLCERPDGAGPTTVVPVTRTQARRLLRELAEPRMPPRPTGPAPGADRGRTGAASSSLSPREIQARLRAGAAPEVVAAEAGVGPDWIERWAGPVRAEQERAVHQGRACVLDTAKRGPSALDLDGSVRASLARRGDTVDPEDPVGEWSAHLDDDGGWVLRLVVQAGRRPTEAVWSVDLRTGRAAARNRAGQSLGWVATATAVPAPAPSPDPDPPSGPDDPPADGPEPAQEGPVQGSLLEGRAEGPAPTSGES